MDCESPCTRVQLSLGCAAAHPPHERVAQNVGGFKDLGVPDLAGNDLRIAPKLVMLRQECHRGDGGCCALLSEVFGREVPQDYELLIVRLARRLLYLLDERPIPVCNGATHVSPEKAAQRSLKVAERCTRFSAQLEVSRSAEQASGEAAKQEADIAVDASAQPGNTQQD
eukprot:3314301-Prymnesium_polylepis.2